jgi:hypothetical protein
MLHCCIFWSVNGFWSFNSGWFLSSFVVTRLFGRVGFVVGGGGFELTIGFFVVDDKRFDADEV